MKKILSMLCTVLLLLGLCGCATPSPTKVVDGFLKNLDEIIEEASQEAFDDSTSEDEKAIINLLKDMIKDQPYTLDNEEIDGDYATVDAHFMTYNFTGAFMEIMSEYLSQGLSMVFSGASDDDYEALLYKIAIEKLTEEHESKPSIEFDYTFELSKIDNKWEIQNANDFDFLDGLTDGIFSAFEGMGN